MKQIASSKINDKLTAFVESVNLGVHASCLNGQVEKLSQLRRSKSANAFRAKLLVHAFVSDGKSETQPCCSINAKAPYSKLLIMSQESHIDNNIPNKDTFASIGSSSSSSGCSVHVETDQFLLPFDYDTFSVPNTSDFNSLDYTVIASVPSESYPAQKPLLISSETPVEPPIPLSFNSAYQSIFTREDNDGECLRAQVTFWKSFAETNSSKAIVGVVLEEVGKRLAKFFAAIIEHFENRIIKTHLHMARRPLYTIVEESTSDEQE